jgi:hypothetical protein
MQNPQTSVTSLNQLTSHNPCTQSISLRPQPRFSDALKNMSFSERRSIRRLPKIKIAGYGDEDDLTDDYFYRVMTDASNAWWQARCRGEEYTPPWIRLPDE